jgi:hypothetical protein
MTSLDHGISPAGRHRPQKGDAARQHEAPMVEKYWHAEYKEEAGKWIRTKF